MWNNGQLKSVWHFFSLITQHFRHSSLSNQTEQKERGKGDIVHVNYFSYYQNGN